MPNIPKKVPMRRCVGCGEHFPKGELYRVVREKDGAVYLDKTGKNPGRGAYICKNPRCLEKARKTRRLEAAFSMAIPEEVYQRLEREMDDGAEG